MKLYDVLRLACGLFLLPHFLLKMPRIQSLHLFYERARMPFPKLLAPVGFCVEGLVVASLLSSAGIRYGAALGAIFMLVAAFATVRLNGSGKWRWEGGGPEYPLFLALLLAILAGYSPL
jgi:putative oxidoreductase